MAPMRKLENEIAYSQSTDRPGTSEYYILGIFSFSHCVFTIRKPWCLYNLPLTCVACGTMLNEFVGFFFRSCMWGWWNAVKISLRNSMWKATSTFSGCGLCWFALWITWENWIPNYSHFMDPASMGFGSVKRERYEWGGQFISSERRFSERLSNDYFLDMIGIRFWGQK